MTETHGYLCKNCLSWWTSYLNKGKLYCECDIPEEEWIFVYRKTFGNTIFGISEKRARIKYKDFSLTIHMSDVVNQEGMLHLGKLKRKIEAEIRKRQKFEFLDLRNIFYICFKKAFTQASGKGYGERCPKCEYFRGFRKCNKGHQWLIPDCKDFILKKKILDFIMIDASDLQIIKN